MTRPILKAPFPWFGGKSRAAGRIWARLGDVANYVEPFAGSLAVLLGRPHAPRLETVNDKDGFISNLWRALAQCPEEVARHADWPVNETDLHARHFSLASRRAEITARLEGDPTWCDPEVAGWWVWGISCWIGGNWCDLGSGPWASVDGVQTRLEKSHHSPMGVSKRLPNSSPQGATGVRRQAPEAEPLGINTRIELIDWFQALQDRLRHVRVCCGDWARVCNPTTLTRRGLCGVVMDPPYSAEAGRKLDCYGATDDGQVAHLVRAWCAEHGSRTDLRIALCGYEGEHEELEALGWSVEAWKAAGGLGNRTKDGRGRVNATRERIWFSPHCLQPAQGLLFEEAR